MSAKLVEEGLFLSINFHKTWWTDKVGQGAASIVKSVEPPGFIHLYLVGKTFVISRRKTKLWTYSGESRKIY